MVYIFGIVGFLGGFSMGLLLIHFFLKSRSKRDLVEDKSLRWTYGVLVWLCAGLGAWAAVVVWGQYFS